MAPCARRADPLAAGIGGHGATIDEYRMERPISKLWLVRTKLIVGGTHPPTHHSRLIPARFAFNLSLGFYEGGNRPDFIE